MDDRGLPKSQIKNMGNLNSKYGFGLMGRRKPIVQNTATLMAHYTSMNDCISSVRNWVSRSVVTWSA